MFGIGRQPIRQLDFIVAGAQKAGTTALNYYLKRHPQIALPRKKELHFFDRDEFFRGGEPDYQPLHQQFPAARPGAVAGENTPNYLYHPAAMPRIHTYNPEMKLVIILRNPIERAFSQWNMQRTRGIEPLDFIDAIRTEPERLKQLPPPQARKFAYLHRGRYGLQLARVLEFFRREQILVLRYEEFRLRQRDMVNAVFRFLDVAVPARFKFIEAHSIPYVRQMSAEEEAATRQLLSADIAQLESLLDWNCANWL